MSDADSARIAKHLGAIEQHLKAQNSILATFNENFVELVKFLKAEIDTPVDAAQLILVTKEQEDPNG